MAARFNRLGCGLARHGECRSFDTLSVLSTDLLQSQRNEIFQLVRESGLDPLNFRWFELSGDYGSTRPALIHRPSKSYFIFDFDSGRWSVEYEPGEDRPVQTFGAGSWAKVVPDQFRLWLKNVEREYTAPDLWAELANGRLDEN